MNTLHTSGVVRRVLAADRDDQEREKEEEENEQEDDRNMAVQTPQIQSDPGNHHKRFCSSLECPRVYWKSMSCACGDGEGGGGGGDGRSSHVVQFTPGGDIVAVAVNQPLMVDTRVLFLSPLSPTSSLSVPLLHHYDPSKKGRYEIVDNKKIIVICRLTC